MHADTRLYDEDLTMYYPYHVCTLEWLESGRDGSIDCLIEPVFPGRPRICGPRRATWEPVFVVAWGVGWGLLVMGALGFLVAKLIGG